MSKGWRMAELDPLGFLPFLARVVVISKLGLKVDRATRLRSKSAWKMEDLHSRLQVLRGWDNLNLEDRAVRLRDAGLQTQL